MTSISTAGVGISKLGSDDTMKSRLALPFSLIDCFKVGSVRINPAIGLFKQ